MSYQNRERDKSILKQIPISIISIGLLIISISFIFILDGNNKSLSIIENSNNQSINNFNDKNITNNLLNVNSSYIQTPYVKEYAMPQDSWPNSILVDKKGMVWTVGTKSNTLISFDPKQEKIKSIYSIPQEEGFTDKGNSYFKMTWTIVQDNDGLIWFSQSGSTVPLWQFDPSTENFLAITSISGSPMQMKVNHETGNIWFTTFSGGTIGVIQKISGEQTNNKQNSGNIIYNDYNSYKYKITEFQIGNETFPSGLFIQDNFLWITDTLTYDRILSFKPIVNAIGEITNIEKIREIPPSSKSTLNTNTQIISLNNPIFNTPSDITIFDNRSLWITEHGTSFVTEYNFNSTQIKRYPTFTSFHHAITLPYWISKDPDGNGFWFNEHYGNRISFLNITDTSLTEYEIPTRNKTMGYTANVLTIATDPTNSNRLWFTEFNTDKIGVVDRGIPIPFNINVSEYEINLSIPSNAEEKVKQTSQNQKNYSKIININIDRINNSTVNTDNANNYDQNKDRDFVFINASSSMNPTGKFVNMTANIQPSIIDLSKVGIIQDKTSNQVNLELKTEPNTPEGNYTIAISATNGKVTKSLFRTLQIN